MKLVTRSVYLLSYALLFLYLTTSCNNEEQTSQTDFFGIQDCGGNFWNPKLCPRLGNLHVEKAAAKAIKLDLGSFRLAFDGNSKRPSLTVSDLDSNQVFQSKQGHSFLAMAIGSAKITETRGSFTFKNRIRKYCTQQTISSIKKIDNGLEIKGHFQPHRFGQEKCAGDYRVIFKEVGLGKLDFSAEIVSHSTQSDSEYNRLYLTYESTKEEQFFGFGMQYTYANMKGRRLTVLSQEQGIGRGLQPVSLGAEITAGKGVSGDWQSSYASVPQFMTNKRRSLFLRNTQISTFDFKVEDQIRIEVFSNKIDGQFISGADPQELLKRYTDYTGRMKPLPEWVDQGVVIGMQGGTEAVRKAWAQAKALKIPVSAFWLQDWVGKRSTSFGSQLWWNWELDPKTYPSWNELIAELNQEGVKVLTYINPFLVDTSERDGYGGKNLYQEAKTRSYLIKDQTGSAYSIENTSFSAGLIDITNPEAQTWIKEVIKDNLIASGASGWMADFGEALPFDSILDQGKAEDFHNQYPVVWADLNKQALEEAGMSNETFFFSRSGFTKSPGASRLFWLGDQLVSWDDKDGIKTAVTGLISSGMSGFSLNHSDIGGYTTISNPIANYHRSQELFQRWTELNAFTTMMRTHEGNRPSENHQYNDSPETLKHFAYFSKIHKALTPYRRMLMNEAYESGMPVVRHLFLHYPEDPNTYLLRHQFMLGDQFIIAPVLDKGKKSVGLYLPSGDWVNLWDGTIKQKGFHEVDAPIGKPPVFFRSGSEYGTMLAQKIKDLSN